MIDWDSAVLGPCLKVFGEPVTHISLGGSSAEVSGIFDEAYHEVVMDGEVPISSEIPVLGVRLSVFTDVPRQGDSLVIRGILYLIREVRTDGHGSAKLMLNYGGEAR